MNQNQENQNQWGQTSRPAQFAGAGAGANVPHMGPVASAGVNVRVDFIRRTYTHLFGAILAFAGLCYLFLGPLAEQVAVPLYAFAAQSWWLFLVLFIGVSWIADKWAQSPSSRGMQYLGLGLYVVAEAVIFTPLLLIAEFVAAEKGIAVIQPAAITTLLVFAGLTATVFVTRKDFSFLRGVLGIGSMAALAVIVISMIGGFHLGIFFSVAMVALAGGYILYYTSQVLAHYHPQQHVAAALALFSAVALLFWYIIQLFMSRD